MTTHYNTLGVESTATQDEIKLAYRKLAMKFHPDRGGDQAKFQEIQQAYDIIGDVNKRSSYDHPTQYGHPQFGQGGIPPGFEHIFNGFGDMFHARPNRAPVNKTLNMQVGITLEEAFNGKELVATVTLPSGRDQVIEVKIPPGVSYGTTLRLIGLGDDEIPNIARGDIHLTVIVVPHEVYQRQHDDLLKVVDISCIDAMLGKAISVTTIDNKTLSVNIAPGTQGGQTFAAPGYGMPNINNAELRGRMLMAINITIPTNLTEAQKLSLSQAFN